MAWIYLLVAGLLEIGWPLGLKIAETPDRRLRGYRHGRAVYDG